MGTSLYKRSASIALACLLALTFASMAQASGTAAAPNAPANTTATASNSAASNTTAKKHKSAHRPKHPPAHCKLGQARVKAGKRIFCAHNSLPVVHTTPQAAAAGMALDLELAGVRDRRGRRSPSLASLLRRIGPSTKRKLEQTLATELARASALARAGALTGHTARAPGSVAAVPVASAAARCGTPEELERARKEAEEAPPGEKGKAQKELAEFEKNKSYKNGELEANLDLESGAVKLGIDLKAKGIRMDMAMRTCGEGAVKVDSCPTAEGKVKGSDKSEMELSFKVSEGAKVLSARSFKVTGETTIEAQTGDDGKLDYYDIKHVYDFAGTIGGSKEKFGPVSVDYTYIGEAHIDMRSGSQKPPPAVVDVHMVMAGVDPHELIAAEIELAKKAQSEADKEFSAVVEKATTALRRAEEHWMKPNECAQVRFEPASETLTLKKGQTGTVKSRTEAKAGGAPQQASWTLSAQQNATFTPGGSEGNPLSTSYEVTKAGKGLLVSATFKATSKAGVAEGTWKQKTENVIQVMTGSFSGRDERGGELLEWSGAATWTRLPESPPGASILGLVSAEVTATASGVAPTGCTQTGQEKVPVFIGSPLSVLGEGAPVGYDIDVPFAYPGQMNVTFSGCPKGEGDGPGTTGLPGEALLTGDYFAGGPSALVQTSSDGVTFAGSATASGTEPGERLSWSWSLEGST
jgi:hypothetical protein